MASGPSPIVVPVNSLAARVPPEVLHHVATCAFESLPPLEGQTERFVYSQVCQSWYSGFHTKQEYIVDHSSKSERLASMLRENNGGVDVRSLDITTVEEDATHVFNMFELLRLCKSVRKLEIVMMYPERVFNSNMILASEDADYNALKSLSDLEHFSICSSTPDAWWGNRAFSSLLSKWPKLVHLEVQNFSITTQGMLEPPRTVLSMPHRLHTIHLSRAMDGFFPSFRPYATAVIADICLASSQSLKNVCLDVFDNSITFAMVNSLRQALTNSAPRLRVFKVHGVTPLLDICTLPGYLKFSEIIQQASSLEEMDLSTEMSGFDAIINALSQHPRLRVVSLAVEGHSSGRIFPFDQVISLINLSTSLEIFMLGKGAEEAWYRGDEAKQGDLLEAAIRAGVVVKYG